MSPYIALWLLLGLLKTLQGQTPSPKPAVTPMKNFQSDKFQGEWFVLGLAGNNYKKEDRALLKPFITTIVLSQGGNFQVSSSMRRGQRCDTWSYVMVPAAQPGQFTVESKDSTTNQENVKVVDMDYTKFALILSTKHSSNRTITRVNLLGRNWRLSSRVLDKFACLALSQGLTKKDIVFPDMADWLPHPNGC